jgi:hypothetical protein
VTSCQARHSWSEYSSTRREHGHWCDGVTVVCVNCEQVEVCEVVQDPVYCAAEDLLHVLR